MRKMRGYFGSTEVQEGRDVILPMDKVNAGVRFSWEAVQGAYYTIIVYDIDARHLHYLVVNIPGGQINLGQTVAPFSQVQPMHSTHRYIFALYQQSSLLEVPQLSRNNFNLDAFVRDGSLSPMGDFVVHVNAIDRPISPPKITMPRIPSPVRVPSITRPTSPSKTTRVSTPFLPDSTLTPQEAKYCSCVAKVAAKGQVTNPYAVCAKSTGTTSRHCGDSYDLERIPDDSLMGLATLWGVKVPIPYNRDELLQRIYDFKMRKYGTR